MVKNTDQTKNLSGDYIYNNYDIEILPYFLYEVCINKYWKNGFCLLGHKYFKTDKPLNIKKTSIYKKYKDYLIEKEIILMSAPYEYILKNNLQRRIIKKKKNERARKCN